MVTLPVSLHGGPLSVDTVNDRQYAQISVIFFKAERVSGKITIFAESALGCKCYAMKQRFYKYEGAGNDFVVIDGRTGGFIPGRERVAFLCDRRRGIGADGLMILGHDPEQQFRMRYFNADGGESTMCGNGGRCIALFAEHLGIGGATKRFTGIDGVHEARMLEVEGDRGEVALGMIDVPEIDRHDGYCFLNTGSPHYVEFVEDVRSVDVCSRGAAVRWGEPFAAGGGTNVNFVERVGDGHIPVRTFERGVEDETLACGTGATASALATALLSGSPVRRYRVDVEGGTLFVAFESADGSSFSHVVLTGPAKKVFEGEIDLKI